ncbi:hypothetical protein CRG98_044922 [Punica granatum]|uniref:Uncharacterized protein n=1 Tax=Punica granatum TaxID=22663 RepID=A0A2I0HSH9_PUNGR|nr:hypothetical protein CRG98_044922 [Punica granatum]
MASRELVIQDPKEVARSDDYVVNPNLEKQTKVYVRTKAKGVVAQGELTIKWVQAEWRLYSLFTTRTAVEDQVSNMAKFLERLMKTIDDRDWFITFLMNKLENAGALSQFNNNAPRQAQALGTTTIAPRAPAPTRTPQLQAS